jgi:N-methylhydantoinase B
MLEAGDILRIETGGGGGHGHPFDRAPALVLEDFLAGFVSTAAAREKYGVAITGTAIDEAATTRLRATRTDGKMFHRIEYVETLV